MRHLITLLACVLIFPLLMAAEARAKSEYRVHAGDVLRIEVLEDTTLNRQSLVPPDGRISLPLAGAVAAAGRTVEEIQQDLIKRLTPSFAPRRQYLCRLKVFMSIQSRSSRRSSGSL